MLKNRDFSRECQQINDQDQSAEVLLKQYQRQYSFIMQQTSQFFKECKTLVQRFLSLNQLGMGFNLPLILNNFQNMEQTTNKITSNKLKHKKSIKDRYQISFHQILKRMTSVINDLILFQANFKQQYFGQVTKPPVSTSQSISSFQDTPQKNKNNGGIIRSQSIKSSNSSSIFSKIQESDQMQELRNLLSIKLRPAKQKVIKVCKYENQAYCNIQKLSIKIEQMKQKIVSNKNRQNNMIKIFRENKLQNICQNKVNEGNYLFSKKQSACENKEQEKNRISAKIQYISQYTPQTTSS